MKKVLALSMAALGVAGVVGLASASNGIAQAVTQTRNGQGGGSGRQAMLETKAQIFGMTAEQLQEQLQTKTMSQIAVEKGLSEEQFQAKMTEAAKARWAERGLSDDEIANRLEEQEQRRAANHADHSFGSGEGDRQGGGRHGWNRS